MYLKRLEIKGFKSFADHTELNLNPGINIIVGPNGCGKSNIVDAIRWVLGEANVRHLRGHKNEDVIFNGTDKKKALGMAQVDMTVDNSDGSLPLDYGEITVSRKIFRSGESEFYLNKSRVRMKDVVSLYTDTGLGKKGYSIISQGELERVLNGQPFDRRLMLEEAAGTIRYRQQRDEVQQRILATAQDLIRVEDILNELGSRKVELHAKAEKARTYMAIREEYNSLERQVMAYQIKEASDNLLGKKTELNLRQTSLEEAATRLEDLKISLQQAEVLLDEKRVYLNKLKENRYEIETHLNNMDSEVKLSQERIKNYRERIEAAGSDSEKYALMLEKLEQDLEVNMADFEQEKSHYKARKNEVEYLNQEIGNLEQVIKEQESLFEKQNKLVFERVNRESELKNEITALEYKIKKAQDKKERLFIRLEENEEQFISTEKNARDLRDQIKKHQNHKEEMEKIIFNTEGQRREYLSSQTVLDKEYDQISRQILALEHKLLALRDLQKSYAGYSEGVRSVLKSHDRGEKVLQGIMGLVANLIEIPHSMDLAIDIALGKGMENIVVESAESARRAIQFLKEQRLGRVTFLPLDVLRVQKIPSRVREEFLALTGVLGLASELLKYNPIYDKAVTYLLGRVLLVQDMDCGLKVFKQIQYPLRIVSLDGELISTNGAMTGGTINQKKSSPLLRNREEKNISQQIEELRRSEALNREAAQKLSERLKVINDKLTQGKNNQAEEEFQLKIIRDEEQRIRALLESSAVDKDIYLGEISQFEDFIRKSEEEIHTIHDCHKNIREENDAINDDIERIKTELEINRREYEVKKERFSSHQEQLIMKKRELENIEKNIAQFNQVKKSYQQSGVEVQALNERLQKEVEIHLERIRSTDYKIENKQHELNIIIESVNLTRNDEQKISADIEGIRRDMQPLQKQILDRQDQIRTIEMKIVRMETELEGLEIQWREKFGQENFEEHNNISSSRQLREYRTRIEELQQKTESLGSIDVGAIKEYDEVKIRYDFLHQQTADLSAAKNSLEKLLHETEKIMSKNFSQFLTLAYESFKRTFVEIFNGGDASLNIESVNDLAAGVDIVVKMPGKRSQSLNLLSGGERALTCIAFIFSLLRLKPAPFCLLDEIDASLDETNLVRFADFVKGMASDTQFIVITHRQATIEAGTNIYGITMPQEGISSILSVNCDEVQSLAG